MKRLAIGLVVLSIFFITGCEEKRDLYVLPEDAKIEINAKTIEVFKSYKLYDLIGNTNMEVDTKDTSLDTETIGEHTVTLDLTYNKKKYKYDLKYTVKDIDPPRFIQASTSRSTLLTQVIDPCESIVTGDNYDVRPTCKIEGEVDYTKLGTYNVEYVLTDSSNNETRKKLTINVLDKNPSGGGSSTSPRTYTYIENVMNNYKNDNTSIGIDVSRYQGNVDWDLVKEAGIEFVIMRIGVQTSPTETLDVDTKFNTYFEEAKKRGFKVGVYVYNTSISKDMGIKTAQFVIDNLHGEKLDLPVVYDWENWKHFNEYNISLHTLKDAYNGFKETLEKAGYESTLYSSKYYLENAWLDIEQDDIWLAHYTSHTTYAGNYYMWQMCSDGKVPGITDNTVDIDILYKNKKNI